MLEIAQLQDWPCPDYYVARHEAILPASGGVSAVIITPHKCGSTWIEGLLGRISEKFDLPFFSPESYEFQAGRNLTDRISVINNLVQEGGRVLGVFRAYLPVFEEVLSKGRKGFILIRDPRDVVCSYYSSIGGNHALPKEGTGRTSLIKVRSIAQKNSLEECITLGHFDFLFENMLNVARLSRYSGVRMFKYEQVLFDPSSLVSNILELLGVCANNHDLREFVTLAHWSNQSEDLRRIGHIQSPIPGRYLSELSFTAQEYIQTKYPSVFWELGYIPEFTAEN
jgi:hypothetical protein